MDPIQDCAKNERDALLELGLRAAWLHLTLTGPRGTGLTPRDRQLLTLVATAGHGGLTTPALTAGAPAIGIQPGPALLRVAELADQGLLSTGTAGVDLPTGDLTWISRQLTRLQRRR